jgi:hypothetical protein
MQKKRCLRISSEVEVLACSQKTHSQNYVVFIVFEEVGVTHVITLESDDVTRRKCKQFGALQLTLAQVQSLQV